MDPATTRRRAVLSRDTDPDAEARQIETWRSLSTMEIAAIVAGASSTARALEIAGLRSRHPNASDRELVVRFAALTLGRELAILAYPELDRLDL